MKIIEGGAFDEERAFYGEKDIYIKDSKFDGALDGESAFKEAENIRAEGCIFNLRYPFWHDDGVTVENCELTENCRAALWYSQHIDIKESKLNGIKALRECEKAEITDCSIASPEFGWSTKNIGMKNTVCEGEYFMLRGENLTFSNISLKGKYSFQYINSGSFDTCEFDTKDAFWHSKNVTVKNSVIKGEYLGWYSENLTLENCKIYGTQPFCYCRGLKLTDCEMIDTDLAFEKSYVTATVKGHIESIKNPYGGEIICGSTGEIIIDDSKAECKITVKEKQ